MDWLIGLLVAAGVGAGWFKDAGAFSSGGGVADTQSDDHDSHSRLFDDDNSSGISSASAFASSVSSLFDDSVCSHSINPANGLPMMGCVDIEGNAYGTDSSHWDDHLCSTSSIFDDSSSSCSSMFDDPFSSSSSMFDD